MDAELQWDAAILTVMVNGDAQNADGAGSRALQSMVTAWREAPVAGTLSQKVRSSVQGLVQSAAPQQPPHLAVCTRSFGYMLNTHLDLTPLLTWRYCLA